MAFKYTETERIFVSGKIKFINAFIPNQWEKWTVSVYLDKESYELVLKLKEEKGLMNKLGKDDDGYYMTFSRPTSMQTRKGKVIPFNPPIILAEDGVTQLSNTMLGPASDVEVKLEFYAYSPPGSGENKKYAVRWEALRVITHVPATIHNFPKLEEQQARGLAGRPEPKW
jgi:hypothetical protein